MSFLLHALIAVSYAVVATVAGYFVPVVFTALSAMVAPLIAAGVFILGLIAHVAFVGGERHRRLSQAVGGARLAQRQQQEDFDHLRREMRSLRQDVGGGESSDGDKRYSKVVAEVKILQGLIEQFYRHTGKAEVAAAARAEATVAAMDPGSVRPAPRGRNAGRRHAGRGNAGRGHAGRGHAGRGHAGRGHAGRGHAGRGHAGRRRGGLGPDSIGDRTRGAQARSRRCLSATDRQPAPASTLLL